MDAEFMPTLKARLEAKKDEDQLYTDLLAAKLRKLAKLNKLRAKHEIDDLMFKYELQAKEIAKQQSPNTPPVTPLSPFASPLSSTNLVSISLDINSTIRCNSNNNNNNNNNNKQLSLDLALSRRIQEAKKKKEKVS